MRWPVSILFLWLPAAAPAETGDGSASQPLDTARRDLQVLQAGSEENRLGDAVKPASPQVPSAALPQLDAPAPCPVVLAVQKSKDDKSHWLLDAMAEQKKSSDPLLGGEKSAGKDSAFPAGVQNAANEAAGPKVEQPTPVVSNPLTPFLNQWMTPQDYTLLEHPVSGGPAETPAGLPGDSVRETETPVSNGLASPPNTPSPFAGTGAKSNPYLTGIADFSPPPAGPLMTVPPFQPAGVSPAPALPPAASPASPPPFAPPDDTEKSFPQLKNHF